MKFLNVTGTVWLIMAVCAAAAVAYAMVCDRHTAENGKAAFRKQRYGAIGVCILTAVLATVISKNQPYVGAPMLGLIISIVVVNIVPEHKLAEGFKGGAAFAGRKYLNLGIVCLGATLAFTDLFGAAYALPIIIFNGVLSFAVAFLVGRKALRVSGSICSLVASGTCICGGTAIAAVSPIIKAKEEETAYAMTAIFLFDLLACLSYPYLAVRLGLSETQFGFLAGTAINDTSSVVAAQETYASLNGLSGYALPAAIKVVRTTMILVLALIFSLLSVRKQARAAALHDARGQSVGAVVWQALPKFILAFIGMIACNTLVLRIAPDAWFYTTVCRPFFANGYKFFVTAALCGVGYKIRFKELLTRGIKPAALGGCTWLAVFASSLAFAVCFAEKLLG